MADLFTAAEAALGELDVVVFNAGARVRGQIQDLDPAEVERVLAVSALGGFHVVQQAAKRLVPRGTGRS